MIVRNYLRLSAALACTGMLVLSASAAMAKSTAVSPQTTTSVDGRTSIVVDDHVVVVSGHVSAGVLNGEANEIVYDDATSHKVSQLEWDLQNVAMVGIGGSVTPTSWLKLNADAWINVSEGTGDMDDYDWLVLGWDEWTHWSHHDDTDVDEAILLDINAEINLIKHGTTTFFGIVGYKRDSFEWSSYGGEFIYSVFRFRDFAGQFRDGLQVISYEQTYSVPYIGVGFEAELTPITLSGRLIGSAFVDLETEDIHYLRNLSFVDDFETGNMIGLDLAAAYPITANLSLHGAFQYQQYSEVKGSTTITDLGSGQQFFFPGDAAGADNMATIFSIGLVYTF